MLILKAAKRDVIRHLEQYSAALGGRVKRGVYEKISGVYHTLRDSTTSEARYLEIDENEIDSVFAEYLRPIIVKNNLVVCVYMGRQTSVYAKQKIEAALKNAVAIYTFPTTWETDKIIIWISWLNAVSSEVYDVDFAASLLRYYDE